MYPRFFGYYCSTFGRGYISQVVGLLLFHIWEKLCIPGGLFYYCFTFGRSYVSQVVSVLLFHHLGEVMYPRCLGYYFSALGEVMYPMCSGYHCFTVGRSYVSQMITLPLFHICLYHSFFITCNVYNLFNFYLYWFAHQQYISYGYNAGFQFLFNFSMRRSSRQKRPTRKAAETTPDGREPPRRRPRLEPVLEQQETPQIDNSLPDGMIERIVATVTEQVTQRLAPLLQSVPADQTAPIIQPEAQVDQESAIQPTSLPGMHIQQPVPSALVSLVHNGIQDAHAAIAGENSSTTGSTPGILFKSSSLCPCFRQIKIENLEQ